MATPWFKFYGGEYLAKPKMDAFDGNERSAWLTLLCLSSQSSDGFVLYTSEEKLLERAGIRPSDRERYRGLLDKFVQFGMIEYCNGDVTQGFKPRNWEKRQFSESYERVKRYREKTSNEEETKKSLLDKIRIDKIREEYIWLDVDSWLEWEQHRKEIKKPLKDSTRKLQLKLLEENKNDHKQIIKNSIMNGWTGLFELKGRKEQREQKVYQAKKK